MASFIAIFSKEITTYTSSWACVQLFHVFINTVRLSCNFILYFFLISKCVLNFYGYWTCTYLLYKTDFSNPLAIFLPYLKLSDVCETVGFSHWATSFFTLCFIWWIQLFWCSLNYKFLKYSFVYIWRDFPQHFCVPTPPPITPFGCLSVILDLWFMNDFLQGMRQWFANICSHPATPLFL